MARAHVARRHRALGGRFYLAESHPAVFLVDEGEHADGVRLTYLYFRDGEPLRFNEP